MKDEKSTATRTWGVGHPPICSKNADIRIGGDDADGRGQSDRGTPNCSVSKAPAVRTSASSSVVNSIARRSVPCGECRQSTCLQRE